MESVMSGHLYKVTLEQVADLQGNPVESSPLTFETKNHEDIFKIVEKLKARVDFSEDDAAAFAVGLKLFSGIMVKNKEHKMFKRFLPEFADFMQELKQS